MSRALAILFLALSLTACSAAGSDAVSPSASPSAAAPTASKTPVEQAGLVGDWTSPQVTEVEVTQMLKAAALTKAGAVVVGDLALPKTFVLQIEPSGYRVTADGALIDHGSLALTGPTLVMSPECAGCAVTYTYSLTGDDLRLTFVSDTSPAYKGMPDEAFQRAIYTTAAFTRR